MVGFAFTHLQKIYIKFAVLKLFVYFKMILLIEIKNHPISPVSMS